MSEEAEGPDHMEIMVNAHLWFRVQRALEADNLTLVDITGIMAQAEDFDPRVRTFAVQLKRV